MVINYNKNNIFLSFEVLEDNSVSLINCSNKAYSDNIDEKQKSKKALGYIHTSGENQNDHHGAKHITGDLLYYDSHILNDEGLFITLKNDKIKAVYTYIIGENSNTIKSFVTVTNIGVENIGLEYISSFYFCGLPDDIEVMLPHNSWCREVMWRKYTLNELGFNKINAFSMKRINVSNTGTWSTKEYLPMGCVYNSDIAYLWQIEHNGSWNWEICDYSNMLYLALSGPSENENHWWKSLKPNESFETVKCCVSIGNDFDEALSELTKYRRTIIRKSEADKNMPVIFNDYMNCIWADPTTEKVKECVDAAKKAGAEYYVMDAGWYADGTWWETVGEWKPQISRFPNGMEEVFDYIREQGLIPGIWLEPEVMGIGCPCVSDFPDECFFVRHGKKVIDHGRYQFDFRSKKVCDYLTKIVDGLVEKYGVGYFKFDYNIDGGIGTEINADSFGDGLLEANKAYNNWIKSILDKHPELILESCASGGLRMDYETLKNYTIQSTSDQENWLQTSKISANCATAVVPEQAAVWSYPMISEDKNNISVNMANSILVRMQLSGDVMHICDEDFEQIKEGVSYYKEIRKYKKESLPFYPLGLCNTKDNFAVAGYKAEEKVFLNVWKFDEDKNKYEIPIKYNIKDVKIGYPKNSKANVMLDDNKIIVTNMENNSALVLECNL